MPVNANDIAEFCALFRQCEWRDVHFKMNGVEIFMSKDRNAVGLLSTAHSESTSGGYGESADQEGSTENYFFRTPIFGTLRLTDIETGKPFVVTGDQIHAGEVLADIEMLGVRTPVKVDRGGMIVCIHAESGALVDFDAPLFSIAPVE